MLLITGNWFDNEKHRFSCYILNSAQDCLKRASLLAVCSGCFCAHSHSARPSICFPHQTLFNFIMKVFLMMCKLICPSLISCLFYTLCRPDESSCSPLTSGFGVVSVDSLIGHAIKACSFNPASSNLMIYR